MHGSKFEQTIGIGGTQEDSHIEGDELQRVEGMVSMGSADGGNIVVDGVVRDVLHMIATGDDAQIIFSGSRSTFDTLMAEADNGVQVRVDSICLYNSLSLVPPICFTSCRFQSDK